VVPFDSTGVIYCKFAIITYACDAVVGPIPSSFCNSSGISIDVSGTGIVCYSGCLTSAHVLITGASGECQNNLALRIFIACICVFAVLVLVLSYGYRVNFRFTHTIQIPWWSSCVFDPMAVAP
jgi:hypothetical protein